MSINFGNLNKTFSVNVRLTNQLNCKILLQIKFNLLDFIVIRNWLFIEHYLRSRHVVALWNFLVKFFDVCEPWNDPSRATLGLLTVEGQFHLRPALRGALLRVGAVAVFAGRTRRGFLAPDSIKFNMMLKSSWSQHKAWTPHWLKSTFTTLLNKFTDVNKIPRVYFHFWDSYLSVYPKPIPYFSGLKMGSIRL